MFMNVGEFFKSVARLWVITMLTAVVILVAFTVGYLMGATQGAQIAAVPGVQPSPQATEASASPEFSVFWEAWRFVEQRFYGKVPSQQERVYGAIRGMVSSFGDQNTAFIDPPRAAIFKQDVTGSFEGIGAAVRMDDLGRLYIVEPFPGRPAAEAGLEKGDIILKVDGVSVEGMNLYEAISMIRGPADTKVVLTIYREGAEEPFEVTVVRARIEIEVVESKRLDHDIGYVSLSEFSRGAGEKVGKAIQALEAEGQLKGLVFDLRNNPGGLLDEAVFVGSQFIADGVITIEREKGGTEQVFEAQPDGVATKVPLAVLVNGGSASASEIVAGAIQENKRGVLIGEQTFGKGTVQIPYTLSDSSELRVTIAEWLTPKGQQINHEGIIPDVVVKRTQSDFKAGRDPQLDRAVEHLLEQK
jgi:carboxyl-terminal processing protease